MVEHQAWVVAEPSPDGDPERIVVATRDAHDDEFEAQREESRVVVRFEDPNLDDVRASLASVSDHLDRLLFVAAVEWGDGATESWLYEPGEGSLGEPVDPHELDAARAGDWIEERPDLQTELLE